MMSSRRIDDIFKFRLEAIYCEGMYENGGISISDATKKLAYWKKIDKGTARHWIQFGSVKKGLEEWARKMHGTTLDGYQERQAVKNGWESRSEYNSHFMGLAKKVNGHK